MTLPAPIGAVVRAAQLLKDTIGWIGRGSLTRQRSQFVAQLYEMGNRSVIFITVTLGVLGMISVFQVLLQVDRILPEYAIVGPAFIQTMVREFAPTIAGLMIATRVGSGIAAEIGSMVVTEQVDALRMSNADPIDYLVAPRFAACALQTVLLTMYGGVIGVISGGLVAWFAWEISPGTFFRLDLVGYKDLLSGFLKAATYGMAIPIAAAQAGLETRGGSEGVGAATTRAVVNASFCVVVLDFLVSGLSFFFLFGGMG
ncbi:MAG: phospholipid/cholesterol/gamma-HCH transport system permease protein [Myxococcota bacterium]|jgi:phospholipid/cholesterol/gamma-HCH transport system permease protein